MTTELASPAELASRVLTQRLQRGDFTGPQALLPVVPESGLELLEMPGDHVTPSDIRRHCVRTGKVGSKGRSWEVIPQEGVRVQQPR
jgi:hypothetical protein